MRRDFFRSAGQRVLLLGVIVAVITAVLYGQAQTSSGDLKGTVVDQSGLAIGSAKVLVTDQARGFSREAVTDGSGEYRFALLPPGRYKLRLEAAGFSTRVLEGIEIRVGDTVVQQTTMDVGAVNTEVTVSAQAPVIELERAQQAATIDWRGLVNLPINRRNYLDLALLTPGVTATNDLVDGTDYRVAQTPQSGLNFGAANGRGNGFLVDGVENYINSGGVRTGISQEVVQEFQVNRNSFGAEFGGGGGGAVSIITKTGSNELHGNVFGFLRHRSIQARNYFDSEKSAFTRAQYGATLGGPIRKNQTFFFAGFERLDRHETAFVPILWDRAAFGRLTPSQQQLADFFAVVPQLQPLAAAMKQRLITNNFPGTLKLFDNNSGNFPFAQRETRGSLRVDHRLGDRHNIFARGNYSRDDSQNAQFGALIAFNRGRAVDQKTHDLVISDTYMISQRWVSETRFLWSDLKLAVIPTDMLGPEITITGYGSFGRDVMLPSTSYERHFVFSQVFNVEAGRHAFKFGFEYNPVRDRTVSELFMGGRFQFGEAIPLGALFPIVTGDPNATKNLASLLAANGKQALIPNLSIPITALQAFNLGLPTIYQQGFGDPNWDVWFKRHNFFVQDSFKIVPNLLLNLGVRYEYEIPPQNIPTDPNNIAPRFSFAWTPRPNGKTVIRGGWGMYYGMHTAQESMSPGELDGKRIEQVLITPLGIPGLLNPVTKQPLTSFDVYQYVAAKGIIGKRTITPADIAPLGLKPGPNVPGRVIFGVDPDYRNMYSHQASFEIEHAVGNYAISVGYNFNRGLHIGRTRDQNLYYAGRTALNQPVFGFWDPGILQLNMFESNANSFYHAAVVQVSKRFSGHIALNAHYTFSKTIDEVLDFNSDFEPNDQLNARAERALSSFHQKHRFVGSAVLESPFHGRVFRDFILSPIVTASSGRPFNLLTGFDNYGDRHPTTHRPYNAGRNIGTGPNYFSIDMRVSRKFPFSADGQRNVEFTAEGFNLLNRTNFKSINNTVGNVDISKLPRPIVGQRGVPTTPLSFTAAFDPRQFQFGLKVNF